MGELSFVINVVGFFLNHKVFGKFGVFINKVTRHFSSAFSFQSQDALSYPE